MKNPSCKKQKISRYTAKIERLFVDKGNFDLAIITGIPVESGVCPFEMRDFGGSLEFNAYSF